MEPRPIQPGESWSLRAKPRTWQLTALGLWKTEMRGVVSVVTGGGKTIFAEMCMLHFKDRFPSGKTLIVVPTTALLDQWAVSLVEDLGIPEDQIGTFSGIDKSSSLKPVNIFVINTARKISDYLKPTLKTFLIVDECHRAGSLVNARSLEGDHSATLGLSATPEREYDDGFENAVAPVLGNVIFKYTYEDAYRDKVIAPFELINVRTSFTEPERQEYDRLTQKAAKEFSRLQKEGGPDDTLKRILQRRATVSSAALMRIPVAAAILEQHQGKHSLVFHERIDSADALLNLLLKRNHSATIYNTKIPALVRRDNLRMYRQGMFNTLVSCRALDEGTNIPETSLAVIASSTASQRQRIQRLGRVLRPAPGKDFATIVTIYITDHEENRLREEASRLRAITKVTWVRSERGHRG